MCQFWFLAAGTAGFGDVGREFLLGRCPYHPFPKHSVIPKESRCRWCHHHHPGVGQISLLSLWGCSIGNSTWINIFCVWFKWKNWEYPCFLLPTLILTWISVVILLWILLPSLFPHLKGNNQDVFPRSGSGVIWGELGAQLSPFPPGAPQIHPEL